MHLIKGIKSLLAQNYSFWVLKNWVKRQFFKINSFLSSKEYNWNEESQKSKNLVQLIRLSLWSVVTSIVISCALLAIQILLTNEFELSLPQIISDENYITLLGTISGISGVFIGLYFTAISVVASTSYTRVPNNIRRLLNRERTGNVYIRFLSILTFVCIILISFNILGLPKIEIAIVPLVFFSGVGIFIFSILGKGIFNLFDPTTLSNILFEEEFNWIKNVSADGRNWLKPSFQDYYGKRSVNFLDTLESLSKIAQEEEHLKEQPLEGLAKKYSRFLSFYVSEKSKIPSNSKWFAPKLEQKDWFHTSGFEVTSALRSGTQLIPKKSSDKYYVENRIEKIIQNFVRATISDSEYEITTAIISSISSYIETLCKVGEIKRAVEFGTALNSIIVDHVCTIEGEITTEDSDQILGIMDTVNMIPISIIHSISKAHSTRDYEFFKERIESVDWKNKRTVYENELGFYLNERLEWLYETLNFEIQAESRTISAVWYQTELLLQVEASLIHESTSLVFGLSTKFFDNSFEKLIEQNKFLFASPYISRKIEFKRNLFSTIDQLIESQEKISKERMVKGLPWKEIDEEKIRIKLREEEPKLSKQIAKMATCLLAEANRGSSPDYLGQFSSYLLDYAFYCFSENKQDVLKEIFTSTFFSCVFKHQELLIDPGIEEWQLQGHVVKSSKPIIELMQLCGYGYLFSYMHENSALRELIDGSWDNYREGTKESTEMFIQRILTLINVHDSPYMVLDKNILSHNWEHEVARKLSSIDTEIFNEGGMMFTRIEIPIHKSPVVRAYYPRRNQMSLGYDGIDLFLYTYMEQLDGGIDYSSLEYRRGKNLEGKLDNEVKLYEKYIVEDESDS